MFIKYTFFSDEEMNLFFRSNCDKNGRSNFYLIKSIVSFNPFERRREFHVTISRDNIMKGGEHLRIGNRD
jgi:hypothetical protein